MIGGTVMSPSVHTFCRHATCPGKPPMGGIWIAHMSLSRVPMYAKSPLPMTGDERSARLPWLSVSHQRTAPVAGSSAHTGAFPIGTNSVSGSPGLPSASTGALKMRPTSLLLQIELEHEGPANVLCPVCCTFPWNAGHEPGLTP